MTEPEAQPHRSYFPGLLDPLLFSAAAAAVPLALASAVLRGFEVRAWAQGAEWAALGCIAVVVLLPLVTPLRATIDPPDPARRRWTGVERFDAYHFQLTALVGLMAGSLLFAGHRIDALWADTHAHRQVGELRTMIEALREPPNAAGLARMGKGDVVVLPEVEGVARDAVAARGAGDQVTVAPRPDKAGATWYVRIQPGPKGEYRYVQAYFSGAFRGWAAGTYGADGVPSKALVGGE